MEPDEARRRLKSLFGGDYHRYIDTKLAGDFACELAEKLEERKEFRKKDFLAHCKRCSKEVAGWPEYKKKTL